MTFRSGPSPETRLPTYKDFLRDQVLTCLVISIEQIARDLRLFTTLKYDWRANNVTLDITAHNNPSSGSWRLFTCHKIISRGNMARGRFS